jgi:hypothetical protein
MKDQVVAGRLADPTLYEEVLRCVDGKRRARRASQRMAISLASPTRRRRSAMLGPSLWRRATVEANLLD